MSEWNRDEFVNGFSITREMVQQLLDKIDTTQYPETGAALLHWLYDEEDGDEEEPMELAGNLHDADATLPMQEDTAEFLILLYQSEIAEGNTDAMLNLGSLYYAGRCGVQNYSKAAAYYEMAEVAGSRMAAENLGYIWYYGRTGNVDYEKAFNYFVKAALAGEPRSMYKVADCYRYGHYVGKDETEAFQIYRQMANTLSEEEIPVIGADVYMRLGDCLMEGIGTEKDLLAALINLAHAETLFYDRLKRGDFYQKANLQHVLAQEEKLRKMIQKSLPDLSWSEYEDRDSE